MIVHLEDLSIGDHFEIGIGRGGGGGVGGDGFEKGTAGIGGRDGWVIFVPLLAGDKEGD